MKDIGGDFCFSDLPQALNGDERSYSDLAAEWQSLGALSCYSSGRGAYCAILRWARSHRSSEPTALLPSYLCRTMMEPFQAAGLRIGFYRVHADLTIDADDFDRCVRAGFSLILICDYFGFHQSLGILQGKCLTSPEDSFIVYDATHAALDPRPWGSVAREPDVCLISLRKTIPVVDGALAVWLRRCETPNTGRPTELGKSASLRALAMLLKASYLLDGRGDKQAHLSMYGQSESLIGEEYERLDGMSELSWSMLRRVGVHRARRKRRENYLRLLELLGNVEGIRPLYTVLSDDVYPLGFPIISERRDALRAFLVQNKIYCPVHWALPDEIPQHEFSESHWLSQRILTIPCDQRYTMADMTRVADAIAAF